jgi:hypothetical protein
VSSTNANAICAPTRTVRALSAWNPRAVPPPPAFFNASYGRSDDAWSAGTSATRQAVSVATVQVNNSVVASNPIMLAPMRVSPEAPAIRGDPGAIELRKKTSESGRSVAAT